MTTIRKAGESDIGVLQAISRRTISLNYRSFLGDEGVDGFIDSGAVDQYCRECIGHCFVIVDEGVVLGFCVLKDNLIDLLMIDHEFHRRGLGTKLLMHCEEVLFASYDELKVESFELNSKANGCYEKNGWVAGAVYFDEEARVNKIVYSKKQSNRL